MIRATIIGTFRVKNNRIVKYAVRNDVTGHVKEVEPEKIKHLIKTEKLKLSNYRLTTDNKLIPIRKTQSSVEKHYWLMNKDNTVAMFNSKGTIIKCIGTMPLDYGGDIREWIETRSRFSCARNVKEFFKSIGINSTEDFIHIVHCVSLHDTFWVKEVGSKIKWNTVSPYRHNYSDVISTYALEGTLTGGKEKNYFSPVMSTAGSFPHTWKYNKGKIEFIKASSKYTLGGSNSGREPFSEYYASQIAQYVGFNCVEYRIRKHIRTDKRVDIVTECDCFTTEEVGTVTASVLELKSYEEVAEFCKRLGKYSLETFIDMLFLDCLLLNTDRHFGNIEFFVDNDSLKILGITPIFDNNYALLPRFMEGYDTFERSEYIARDNRSFDDLYKLVRKHKNYRKELIRLKEFIMRSVFKMGLSH